MAATSLIINGTVLTCDAADRSGPYSVLVVNGRIAAITENPESLLKENPGTSIIDARGRLIIPGFVNAHYHGESLLFRSLTRNLHYSLWKDHDLLRHAYDRILHASSHDDVRRLYRITSLAHLASGTTCVGEFPPPFDDSAFMQMIEGIGTTRLKAVTTLQNWDQIAFMQSLRERPVPLAVNLGEEKQLTVYSIEKLLQAAKELKAPPLAHVAEQRSDTDVIRKHFQKDILTLLGSFNAIRPNTIFIHANHVAGEEVTLLEEKGGTVIVTPRSTSAKQTGYPSLRHLAQHAVRLALGTDWGAVDMMDEIRFMYRLPYLVPRLRMFSPLEVLHMATINGAAALGVATEAGSIEVGKRADLLFLNMDDVRKPVRVPPTSAAELADLIVNHFSTGDIGEIMTAGEFMDSSQISGLVSEAAAELGELHGKFFADILPPVASSTEQPPDQGRNVLPFIAETRSQQDDVEGFETGISPHKGDVVETAARPPHPLANRPRPQRDPIKPELPKNTRRVFGEDDDLE